MNQVRCMEEMYSPRDVIHDSPHRETFADIFRVSPMSIQKCVDAQNRPTTGLDEVIQVAQADLHVHII